MGRAGGDGVVFVFLQLQALRVKLSEDSWKA